MSKANLSKAFSEYSSTKRKKVIEFSGSLGIPLNGVRTIEVPSRPGFVYVRLRGSQNELIQAYNDKVSLVYDLPVRVQRMGDRYVIVGRDLLRYQNWGKSSYLPNHGSQHSFKEDNGGAGDITWVDSRQILPLLTYPSGTAESLNVLVYPYTYEWNGQWKYATQTGTASLAPYRPTASGTSRMVLVYMDGASASPQLVAGTPFSSSIVGIQNLLPYIPTIPGTIGFPLAAIKVESGTSSIGWDEIYDLRQYYTTLSSGTNSLSNFVQKSGDIMSGGLHGNVSGTSTADFQWEGDTEPNLIKVDSATDSIALGGTSNGLLISKGGNLLATGTATWFDDVRVEPTVRNAGTKSPVYTNYMPSGTASGIYFYLFDNAIVTLEKEVNFKLQMPHGKYLNSVIHLHVHWTPTSTGASGDKVRWGLEYTKANPNGVFPPTTTIYATDPVNPPSTTPTRDTHYITEFADIVMTGDALSTIILCRLFRNSSDAADTFSGDVGLLYIDCHVEFNKLGSYEEYA